MVLSNQAIVIRTDIRLTALLVDRTKFPRDIPIRVQDAVMVFEPTELYDINAVEQWASLSPNSGWIKLPTPVDERPYAVSMYHQLHCLNSLRYGLIRSKTGANATSAALWHANHCYNYIRMGVLCGSDRTLEPRIVEELVCDDSRSTPPGVPHVCRDWTQIHSFVGENHRRNEDYLTRVLLGA